MNNSLRTIPFDKEYNIKGFDCDIEELNKYITNYASQDIKRYLASVFICVSKDNRNNILGYYTLSSSSIDISQLDNEYTKKLPYYPYLPTILIGRLAADKHYHKQGIGEFLLMDALHKSYKSEVAAFAVIVEAKNSNAINFYLRYGFIQFKDSPKKLFLPMKTIEQLF